MQQEHPKSVVIGVRSDKPVGLAPDGVDRADAFRLFIHAFQKRNDLGFIRYGHIESI